MTSLSILIIGFLLGMKHATEADHLAAVATLATRQNSLVQTMKQGAAWGIGHTLTLGLFGGFVLLLGKTIPQNFSKLLELGVGVMLVLLGADVLRRLMRDRVHFHAHRHMAGPAHFHAHSHAGEVGHDRHIHQHPKRWPLRALCVGMVHGMAGSAALVLLTLEDVPSVGLGILYISLFGLGSVVGMAALSLVIALPLRASAMRLNYAHWSLTALVGLASCALGTSIIYAIGSSI